MTPLALVTPEGAPLELEKKPTTPLQIETSDEPLHIIAARQHAKDSTKKDDRQ
jgi:hypothetical protein